VKTTEEQRIDACSLAHNTLGVNGCVGAPGWGLRRVTNINYSHGIAKTKQQVN
jgi:hypothetical protein